MTESGTDIATIVETNPVAVLIDAKTYTEFYQHIKAEVEAFEPDISTVASRKNIASLAYKVIRTKTAIDAAGKKLNEDARAKIKKIDEARRLIRADLDALAEQARKPLTEWENAEEQRINAVGDFFDHISDCKTLELGANIDTIKLKLSRLSEVRLDEAILLDRTEEGELALASAREFLTQALTTTEKAELDAIELERFRAENEARIKAEREAAEKAELERLAKETADRAAAEALHREEAAKRLAEKAAEYARAEEKRLAEEAIAKVEREKQAAIAKLEAEKLALIREQERKNAERKANEEREAAKQSKREANKYRRARLIKEAKEAILALGIDGKIAMQIVDAIIDGEIPHIKMEF